MSVDKVNLLYVFLRLGLGGAQEIFLRTIAHVDKSRFTVEVCCLQERGRLVPEVEALGVPVFCLDAARFRNDLSVVGRLTRLLRLHHIQVVHTHLYSRANVYGRLAAILARAPVVVAGSVGYGRPRPLKKWVADYALAPFTDHFTALSEATKIHICQEQRVDPEKVSVIYPGIDLERFAIDPSRRVMMRQELGIPTDARVIGTVARLSPEKGVEDLIDVMRHIRSGCPDVRLLIVGDGPKRAFLERTAEDVGVKDAVHFAGMRRDVPRLLRAMDIFALPSRREGFGMALVEAMASELPVVASNVGGVPEVVQRDETGFLVPVGDLEALFSQISRLLNDPELRRTMGESGRQRVEERFTAERAAAQTERLYLSLLARKGLRPSRRGRSEELADSD